MRNWKSNLLVAMLLPLVLLLAACAPKSPAYVSVSPPAIPPLPSEARQGPAPLICSPSCSAALTTERESWLKSLTEAE